jgi:transposase
MAPRANLTVEELRTAIIGWERGYNTYEIARMLGVREHVVYNTMARWRELHRSLETRRREELKLLGCEVSA